MKKLMLIDGHSIVHRAFYGVPDLTNSSGLHVGAIYGFLNILFKLLDEERPDYLCVAFDMSAPTFRHERYAEYKGTRKPMPEELREQIPVLKDVLGAMKITIIEREGIEADDILGTLAKKAESEDMDVSLVSGDRDLLQIATDRIKIIQPKTKSGKTETEVFYAKDVVEKYQVSPAGIIELKALMGDASDNIPGVPKVGEKTATALLIEYGTVENVYANLEKITKKGLHDTLMENRDKAELSRWLATIKTDCDISVIWDNVRPDDLYNEQAYELLKTLGLRKILERFEGRTAKAAPVTEQKSYPTVEDPKTFDDIAKAAMGDVAFYIHPCASGKGAVVTTQESNGQMALDLSGLAAEGSEDAVAEVPENVFTSVSITTDNGTYIVIPSAALTCDHILTGLLQMIGRHDVKAVTYDVKRTYKFFEGICDTDDLYIDDIMLMSYLLSPIASGEYDMSAGNISYMLYKEFADDVERLKSAGMYELYRDVELPLAHVLFSCEKAGIRVDRDKLIAYGESLTGRIKELENSIHEQAGEVFNINSPKQLGEILFEKLKYEGGKKTKSGYSTAADVLEKLAPDHPIVRDILEYRGLTKLKGTYADGLLDCIAADGRIHTTFNQTITATGRISSTDPNLQNIPVRTELGRQIRKTFVPDEGCVFVDADYSQIELRILAHMSQDQGLIEAYGTDADIHRITASKVFGVPMDEVTSTQRRDAKAVNFGLVYGISSFGLSQDLGITRQEAAKYIEDYFATYPGVKEFLDRTVADAKSTGYVTTIYGRRRPIPELKNSNYMMRQFGERVAMNSPIQGTAADIMKIAMIRVYDALKKSGLDARILVQVHDELLLEVKHKDADAAVKLLKEEMENAANLAVKLEVDVHTGNDWYEAK